MSTTWDPVKEVARAAIARENVLSRMIRTFTTKNSWFRMSNPHWHKFWRSQSLCFSLGWIDGWWPVIKGRFFSFGAILRSWRWRRWNVIIFALRLCAIGSTLFWFGRGISYHRFISIRGAGGWRRWLIPVAFVRFRRGSNLLLEKVCIETCAQKKLHWHRLQSNTVVITSIKTVSMRRVGRFQGRRIVGARSCFDRSKAVRTLGGDGRFVDASRVPRWTLIITWSVKRNLVQWYFF